jgi:hypothetical protein
MLRANPTRLEAFTRAYIATALWSTHDESDESGGEPFDSNYDASDLAPETLASIERDCLAFFVACDQIMTDAIETGRVKFGPDFDAWGRAGHDFWLTRNGHGAGFWDGDWPEPFATQLTDASKNFGEIDLYLDDSGAIRASNE